ncbi:MAG: hypothetical protein ACSW8C_03630, partial [bacterium]
CRFTKYMGGLGIPENLNRNLKFLDDLKLGIRSINRTIREKIKTAKGKISDYLTTKIYNSPTKTLITPHPIRRTVGELLINSKLKNIATRTRNKVAELSGNLVTVLQNKNFHTLSTPLSSVLEKMGITNDPHLKEFPTTEERDWSFKLTSDNYATFMYLYKNVGLSCLDNFTKEELLDLLNSELLIPFQKITIADYCKKIRGMDVEEITTGLKDTLPKTLIINLQKDQNLVPNFVLRLFDNASCISNPAKIIVDHLNNTLAKGETNIAEHLAHATLNLNAEAKQKLIDVLKDNWHYPQVLWLKQNLEASLEQSQQNTKTEISLQEFIQQNNVPMPPKTDILQWAKNVVAILKNTNEEEALKEGQTPALENNIRALFGNFFYLSKEQNEAIRSAIKLEMKPGEAETTKMIGLYAMFSLDLYRDFPDLWAKDIISLLEKFQGDELSKQFDSLFSEKGLFPISQMKDEFKKALRDNITPQMVRLYATISHNLYRDFPDLWAEDITSLLRKFQGDELFGQILSLFSGFGGLFPVNRMDAVTRRAVSDAISERSEPAFNSLKKWLALVNARNTPDE